jgi:hypothetical protein
VGSVGAALVSTRAVVPRAEISWLVAQAAGLVSLARVQANEPRSFCSVAQEEHSGGLFSVPFLLPISPPLLFPPLTRFASTLVQFARGYGGSLSSLFCHPVSGLSRFECKRVFVLLRSFAFSLSSLFTSTASQREGDHRNERCQNRWFGSHTSSLSSTEAGTPLQTTCQLQHTELLGAGILLATNDIMLVIIESHKISGETEAA